MPTQSTSRRSVTSRPRRQAAATAAATAEPSAPYLTTITACDQDGRVRLAGHHGPVLLLAAAGRLTVGQRVLVQPTASAHIILGAVTATQTANPADSRVEIAAEHELVMRCGAASLTLTSAGKAILAGEYVLSRARGLNKIKGGSVQIN